MPPRPQAVTLTETDLHALHAVQLQILLEFDRICRELGLNYQLAAGTLLGAVRHQGFIPWDCDIDVAMPRQDFDRLLQDAGGVLDNKYFLQHRGSDPAFRKRIATLRRQGSEFRQVSVAHTAMHHGIHIDIFPFDGVAPRRWWGKLHLRLAWIGRMAQATLNHNQHCHLSQDRPAWQHLMASLMSRLQWFIPRKARGALYDRCLRALPIRQDGYVTCLVSIPTSWSKARRLVRPASEFLPTTLLAFEGHFFPAAVAYDSVLTRLYGEYHQLPPPKLRIPKHRVTCLRLPNDAAGSTGVPLPPASSRQASSTRATKT